MELRTEHMELGERERRVLDGRTWHAFCDALKEAGDVVLRAGNPETPFDRAEGYRYLTRLLRASLESQLEHGDPCFPGFYQLSNETIKIGNDNPDNHYQNATISGRHEYRITGTRGTVHYLSLGTQSGGYGSTGQLLPTGRLDARDMQIEADGSFEIVASAREHPGNWLPMQPETSMLIVRQTFLDRRREEPARLAIRCLDPQGSNALDPATLEETLLRCVGFVRGTADKFVDWMEGYAAHVNQLPPDDQEKCQRAGGDASIFYCQSCWSLEPGEALLIEAKKIPDCESWNFQLSNHWMESLDYRYHRISVNKHTAAYEPDGSVRIVVTDRDPGPRYPNWLETASHRRGGMLFRWIGAREHPPLETRVVARSELLSGSS